MSPRLSLSHSPGHRGRSWEHMELEEWKHGGEKGDFSGCIVNKMKNGLTVQCEMLKYVSTHRHACSRLLSLCA